MFGKTGVFLDGVMFGMVTENMFYLRVDDHNRAAFQEASAFPPLNYEKQGNSIDLAFGARRSGCSTNPTCACCPGALGAGGGAPDHGEATADSAKAKSKPQASSRRP